MRVATVFADAKPIFFFNQQVDDETLARKLQEEEKRGRHRAAKPTDFKSAVDEEAAMAAKVASNNVNSPKVASNNVNNTGSVKGTPTQKNVAKDNKGK